MFEISSYTNHTDFTFNSMKDYVCTILHANNLDAMIDWLNDTQNEKSIGGRDIRNMNFFSAPASTKYHGSYPGGLMKHSILVAENLVTLTRQLDLKWQNTRSPYVVGLFHDLCKADKYVCDNEPLHDINTYSYRNDEVYNHHAEKSLAMLATAPIQLTEEQAACIRWHMGAFTEDKDEWNYYNNAVKKYPNVLWTHTADMVAAKIQGI